MRVIGIVFVLLFLVACAPVPESFSCSANYYEYKTGECCLDKNSNTICDVDESDDVAEKVASGVIEPSEVNGGQLEIEEDAPVPVVEEVPASPPLKEERNKSLQPQKLEDILMLHEDTITGYRYYTDHEEWGPYHLHHREGVMLIEFDNLVAVDLDKYVDRLLIDLENETVTGTCLQEQCVRLKSYRKEQNLSYEEYKPVTILEELEKIKFVKVDTLSGGTIISDHQTYSVLLENGMKVYFDERHHFPVLFQDTLGNDKFRLIEISFDTIPKKQLELYPSPWYS